MLAVQVGPLTWLSHDLWARVGVRAGSEDELGGLVEGLTRRLDVFLALVGIRTRPNELFLAPVGIRTTPKDASKTPVIIRSFLLGVM